MARIRNDEPGTLSRRTEESDKRPPQSRQHPSVSSTTTFAEKKPTNAIYMNGGPVSAMRRAQMMNTTAIDKGRRK